MSPPVGRRLLHWSNDSSRAWHLCAPVVPTCSGFLMPQLSIVSGFWFSFSLAKCFWARRAFQHVSTIANHITLWISLVINQFVMFAVEHHHYKKSKSSNWMNHGFHTCFFQLRESKCGARLSFSDSAIQRSRYGAKSSCGRTAKEWCRGHRWTIPPSASMCSSRHGLPRSCPMEFGPSRCWDIGLPGKTR